MSTDNSGLLKFGKIIINTFPVDNENNIHDDIETDSHNDNDNIQISDKDCPTDCAHTKTSTNETYIKSKYRENKLKHNNYMRQYVNCKYCGTAVRRLNITNHKKTAKCLNRRQELENTKQITLEELHDYLKLIHDKLIILPKEGDTKKVNKSDKRTNKKRNKIENKENDDVDTDENHS